MSTITVQNIGYIHRWKDHSIKTPGALWEAAAHVANVKHGNAISPQQNRKINDLMPKIVEATNWANDHRNDPAVQQALKNNPHAVLHKITDPNILADNQLLFLEKPKTKAGSETPQHRSSPNTRGTSSATPSAKPSASRSKGAQPNQSPLAMALAAYAKKNGLNFDVNPINGTVTTAGRLKKSLLNAKQKGAPAKLASKLKDAANQNMVSKDHPKWMQLNGSAKTIYKKLSSDQKKYFGQLVYDMTHDVQKDLSVLNPVLKKVAKDPLGTDLGKNFSKLNGPLQIEAVTQYANTTGSTSRQRSIERSVATIVDDKSNKLQKNGKQILQLTGKYGSDAVKLIKSPAFSALTASQQAMSLRMASNKNGIKNLEKLINDSGFKSLNGKSAINNDGTLNKNRPAQTVVLDTMAKDPIYASHILKMLDEHLYKKADGGDAQRGAALLLSAQYTGRKKGYGSLDASGKKLALNKLTNGKLLTSPFWRHGLPVGGKGTSQWGRYDMVNEIQQFVDRGEYMNK